MSALPTVLFFTNAEHGQANVNLAAAYELALLGVNVCIASSAALERRVSLLQELVVRCASPTSGKPPGSVSFHECKGFASWREVAIQRGMNVILSHSHGVSGALQSYMMIPDALFPWSREEYLGAIENCKDIIATIKPNGVVVDAFFKIAQDACMLVDQKFVIMSPNSIKDLVVVEQPHLAALWKYPALSSGFSFPLKWWQIPLNIYLYVRLAIQVATSPRISEMRALRKSLGFQIPFGEQVEQRRHGVVHICPALTEIDFPFAVVPEEIQMCGPIILPFDPLEESEPALVEWLDKGPTVMINLGSHVVSDRRVAKEMASALRALLDYHDRNGGHGIQVLWKVMTNEDMQTVIDEYIGKEIKEGKVKMTSWMQVEPVSVLQHSNVICAVHHGGANSFYEAVWSGVPHVVLPVWYDTYDFAVRAEFLNVGVFGNKTCAPSVRTREFSEALVRVTGDTEEAIGFRRSAQKLKEICRAKGIGRKLASEAILREMGVN